MRILLFIIVLYFYIFNPVFLTIGYGSVKIILALSLFYFLIKPSSIAFSRFFKTEALLTAVLIFYVFLNSTRSMAGDYEYPYMNLIWFLESIFLPVILIHFFNVELEKYGLEQLLVITGTVASFVSIFLIYSPDWNDFVRNSLISYSGVGIDRYQEVRGYGIAEGLLGSYAMIQGIILGISIYLMSKNVLFIIPVLPLLISTAFNARIGLIALPISILTLLVTRKINFRWIILFGLLSLIIIFLFSGQNTFIEGNIQTFIWIFSGLDEGINGLNGDFTNGALSTLFQDEVFRPANMFDSFFGTGEFGPNNHRVDNGFSYILWFGGLSLIFIQAVFVFFMFYRLWKVENNKFLVFLLFTLLMLYNSKWNYLFVPSGIARLIGLVYVWKIFYNHRNKQLKQD